MSGDNPLVSVIIPFLNTPPMFFTEAIESVLAQTYDNWELLLVDDGSTGQCSALAKSYMAKRPERIQYLEHDGHQNRGLSASRNVGIKYAKGEYIAFLDSDDVWLPHKLGAQVAILESHLEGAMLYGNTLYWYSWTGNLEDLKRDHMPRLAVPSNTLFEPPALLPLFLRGRAAVPCMSNILVRRKALESIGGFEDAFTDMYEDQVFYAKLSLAMPIYVSATLWDKYRRHAVSLSAVASLSGRERASRLTYLKWLDEYLSKHCLRSPAVAEALQKELWLCGSPDPTNRRPFPYSVVRRTKKWLLRLEEVFLPAPISRWLWCPRPEGSQREQAKV